jgi:hypothetical protein
VLVRGRKRGLPATAYLAGLTGGIFFAHTLIIELIRSALGLLGLRTALPWEALVAILFVGTVSVTAGCVAIVLRTPLRWVLGGPVRSAQRASYTASPPAGPMTRSQPTTRQTTAVGSPIGEMATVTE